MTIKISHSTVGQHRDTEYIATCILHDESNKIQRFYMGGYNVTIAQLVDRSWWIIPNRVSETHLVADVGPYDTAEQAAVMIRLLSTTTAF